MARGHVREGLDGVPVLIVGAAADAYGLGRVPRRGDLACSQELVRLGHLQKDLRQHLRGHQIIARAGIHGHSSFAIHVDRLQHAIGQMG